MFNSLNDYLRSSGRRIVMDGCGKNDKEKKSTMLTLDAAESAESYVSTDIAMRAAATMQQWAETDDLDDGETYADRLFGMFVGIADENKDGEISKDEEEVIVAALNAAFDYLLNKGVSEDDASKLLNDWDDGTADRVRDLLADSLPDGEDAEQEDIDNFVFSAEENEAVLDAVYKKTFAIRHGKKVRINKRISGTVRLTAKQKVAIRKAQMKSHSASAMMRRMKSMRLRRRAGL